MRTDDQRLRVSGLRDYRSWAFDLFPGKVGPTDLDSVVQNDGPNRFLVFEFKRPDEPLGTGQEKTLRGLAKLPEFSVAVVVEVDGGFQVGHVNPDGVSHWDALTLPQFRRACQVWWHEGYFGKGAA